MLSQIVPLASQS